MPLYFMKSSCVYPKEKDILLYNHNTDTKFRKFNFEMIL